MKIEQVVAYATALKAEEIHFTEQNAQCLSNNLLLSIPFKNKLLAGCTVDCSILNNIINLSTSSSRKIEKTKNNILITDTSTSFKGRLLFTTDWDERAITEGQAVKMRNDQLQMLALLLNFTTYDSDNKWATAINVADNFAYSTNNIVVCRVPFAFPDYLLSKELLALHFRLSLDISTVIVGERSITFVYDNDICLTYPRINEIAPAFAPVFDKFKQCDTLPKDTLKMFLGAIALTTDNEIKIKKEGIITNNGEFHLQLLEKKTSIKLDAAV